VIVMNNRKLLGTGITGSAVAALCCGTPLLAIALGAFGLSAWLAWVDYVVLPALLAFFALSVYAIYRMRRRRTAAR
jgi:mercuric ion transport protein